MNVSKLSAIGDTVKVTPERQRNKSESCACSKIFRKSSPELSSIENLEDLLTCPIHLGVVDEPRQLQCGHVFCLSCLESYANHNFESTSDQICCPLCRQFTQLDHRGIKSLATSYLHKQLNEYLFNKKQKVLNMKIGFDELHVTTSSNIFTTKLQMMNQILKDIKSKEISLDELSPEWNENENFILNLKSVLDQHETQKQSIKSRFRSKSVLISNHTDFNLNINDFKFESFDENTIRKNMRKYREYTLAKYFVHHNDNCVIGITSVYQTNILDITDDNVALIYIIRDSPYLYLANSLGCKVNCFLIEIENVQLYPIYIKCYKNTIFVSGKTGFEPSSRLIQLTLNGEKEKISANFPGLLGGFCFDLSNNSILIAYPSKNQVLQLDSSLENQLKVFEFGNLSPMFVAISLKTREIWVSCPSNGRIAVYDEVSDNYLHLATNQIYDSTPTHIIETLDNRLLFLDVGKSRLFWIFRWNNCLYIQLLMVIGSKDNLKINSIESISENMILFSDGNKTFVAKPNRSPKEEHQKLKCGIL